MVEAHKPIEKIQDLKDGILKAGSYRICVNDAGNCIGYSIGLVVAQTSPTCTIVTKTAIANKQTMPDGLSVQLSPNPSSSQFTLQIHAAKREAVTIRVWDVNGRIVYTVKGLAEQAFRFGEPFANGIYMVEVRQGDEVKIVKGVKIRN